MRNRYPTHYHKESRDMEILRLYECQPRMSAEHIGYKFGLTRTSVLRIIRERRNKKNGK